jgi:hypothetical protein
MQTQRSEYLSFRRKFEPENVKLVIVAESPPASDEGKYFYNPDGKITEWLFAALMKQLGVEPKTKDEGLREFQRQGWTLIDATYEPVNKRESEAAKKEVILRDYPLLRDDLKRLLPDLSTPVVLVKANVCRLLEPKLTADGFNVINKGQSVSFPAFGQQPDFHRQFRAILKSAKILSDGSDAPSPRPPRPRRKKRPAEEIGNATLTDYLKEVSKLFLTTFIKEFPNALLTAFKRYEHVGAGEMVHMQQRKLHEAMEEVLRENNCGTTFEIAEEVNRRGLYTQGNRVKICVTKG